jgi:methionine synthase I (cobalamin-dependent)
MQPDRTAELKDLSRKEHILVLDGAMGTMIQRRRSAGARITAAAASPDHRA